MYTENHLFSLGFTLEYNDDNTHFYSFSFPSKSYYDFGFITSSSNEGPLRVFMFPYDEVEIKDLEDLEKIIKLLNKITQ